MLNRKYKIKFGIFLHQSFKYLLPSCDIINGAANFIYFLICQFMITCEIAENLLLGSLKNSPLKKLEYSCRNKFENYSSVSMHSCKFYRRVDLKLF